jgi:hypothetical protein
MRDVTGRLKGVVAGSDLVFPVRPLAPGGARAFGLQQRRRQLLATEPELLAAAEHARRYWDAASPATCAPTTQLRRAGRANTAPLRPIGLAEVLR